MTNVSIFVDPYDTTGIKLSTVDGVNRMIGILGVEHDTCDQLLAMSYKSSNGVSLAAHMKQLDGEIENLRRVLAVWRKHGIV